MRRVGRYLIERAKHGITETVGPLEREVVFLVDGVGGFQSNALAVRKVLRENGGTIGSVLFDWQCGLRGEIFTDLMWYRRNRRKGRELAERVVDFHDRYPTSRLHCFAVSAGTGIAVFACEALGDRRIFETVVLACPALSPAYNLGAVLRSAKRVYTLASRRDYVVLGWGTRLFGTVDRVFCNAAGSGGFRWPVHVSDAERLDYERLAQVHWSPDMLRDGNRGGHGGWTAPLFLEKHLMGLLQGRTTLPVHTVNPG